MVERRVLDVTRRGVLAALSASSIAGFVKIYGDNELNVLDSAWRAVFPRKAARIRGPLQPALAAALSGAIRAAALEDLRLLSPAALAAAEVEQAARAASFFPKLSPADLAAVAALPPAPAGGAPLAPLLESEAGANLALYATLHSLEPALPSPRSRKDMAARVGRRVADALLPPPPPAAPGGAPSARGPAGREAFLGALRALLDAYAAGGFAVASIGEKGVGELDSVDWDLDGRGALAVYLYDVALIDAAQALAGESFQDLSELLLPTPVLPALLARFGVRCDAESYYLSSVYTRNPADYRPDCVAVQCNLEAL